MKQFKYHIFVCENVRKEDDPRGSCGRMGSTAIRECMKAEIKQRGLRAIARANKAGCLDTCELGPSVVVYPEGVWYTIRNEEEARRVVAEHVAEGRVVEEFLMDNRRKG
jgi:(2Fe-2S) ferredoxin